MKLNRQRPAQAIWASPLFWLFVLTLAGLLGLLWQQTWLIHRPEASSERLVSEVSDLLRKRDQLALAVQTAQNPGQAAALEQLLAQHQAFTEQMHRVEHNPERDLLASSPVYRHTQAALRSYMDKAQPLLQADAGQAPMPAQTAKTAALLPPLQALESPLLLLSAHAHTASQKVAEQRRLELRTQSLMLLLLTWVLASLLLGLVWMQMRQLRAQTQQEKQLRRLNQELSRERDHSIDANRGKDVFLAAISHELRTPFQGLMGMLQLLRDSSLDAQQRDYLETARHSAKHLLGILNDILDISTIETGSLKLSPAPTALRLLLEQVQALMQGAAHAKGLELKVQVDDSVPPWVMADAKRLRQVLFNLLGNAVKFTRDGGVYAQVSAVADTPGKLQVTIRDTGIGMDKETLSKLFTRFYQADATLRRRIGGTGLGLEISRNLARLMGGDVSVESELGVGSVFTVTLVLPPTAAPQRRSGPDRRDTPSLRILMAEADKINRKVVIILMNRLGHQVSFCDDGPSLIEQLQREGPAVDAVVLDYHMAGMDGLATTQAIRHLAPPLNTVPIVMVSTDVLNDTRNRALDAGVTEFLTQPLQPEDLQRAFKRFGLLPSFADSGLSVLGSI